MLPLFGPTEDLNHQINVLSFSTQSEQTASLPVLLRQVRHEEQEGDTGNIG